MTPEQFCYWLQGRAELEPAPPTAEQWQAIREHLATVFCKVTPPLGAPPSNLDLLRWNNPTSIVAPSAPIYTVECKSTKQAEEAYC